MADRLVDGVVPRRLARSGRDAVPSRQGVANGFCRGDCGAVRTSSMLRFLNRWQNRSRQMPIWVNIASVACGPASLCNLPTVNRSADDLLASPDRLSRLGGLNVRREVIQAFAYQMMNNVP